MANVAMNGDSRIRNIIFDNLVVGAESHSASKNTCSQQLDKYESVYNLHVTCGSIVTGSKIEAEGALRKEPCAS